MYTKHIITYYRFIKYYLSFFYFMQLKKKIKLLFLLKLISEQN